jgi:hypothetical protein
MLARSGYFFEDFMQTQARFLLKIRVNRGNDVREVSKCWPGQIISLRTPYSSKE